MNTKRITKISILVVGLVLSGLLAFQLLAVGNSLVGSWTVTVTSDQPAFTSYVNFSSDGTLTEMSDGVVGMGVWQKLSGHKYAFTLWECIQIGGNDFRGKVTSTITLDDKDQYSGPFFYEFMGLDGKVINAGHGTATGVRNHVEPMPK
jgi:hypothetical protein